MVRPFQRGFGKDKILLLLVQKAARASSLGEQNSVNVASIRPASHDFSTALSAEVFQHVFA
jgi:hypothetical protein